MLVAGAWRRAIECEGRTVRVLDQQQLPFAIVWVELANLDDTARAIREMTVRGAPLIGATAAYGVALAGGDPAAYDVLAGTRPTAVNLRWALAEMRSALADVAPSERTAAAFTHAAKICNEEVARCEAIANHGVDVIRRASTGKGPVQVLTHCNAGWLATVDWGTALAPVYRAHEQGIPLHVWVDETRPRNQGLLTAWELAQQGIPHTVIADNAGGHLMQRGQVDVCIVGTDRTTRDGDVCNKIGTYLKALAAHHANVPFYVAAPSPSIDWTIANGADIPIEERSGDEVRTILGRTGDALARLELVPATTAVCNPAFDVTPAKFVTGLITERGIATPGELAALFGKS